MLDQTANRSAIKLAGHGSFQLETGGPGIFVNVPDASQIAVVDREKRAVTAKWPVTSAGANYPMALDGPITGSSSVAGGRSYRHTTARARSSPRSTSSATRTICSMTPPAARRHWRRRLRAVLEQQDANRNRQIQKLPTASGARTGLYVPELGKLFVAVPHRGAQQAEIRVYDAGA